jgi:hypothetical protein
MIDRAANSLPQVRAGTINAYALTAKTRLPAAPETPTSTRLDWTVRALWPELASCVRAQGHPQRRGHKAQLRSGDGALSDPTMQRRLADIGQEIFSKHSAGARDLSEGRGREMVADKDANHQGGMSRLFSHPLVSVLKPSRRRSRRSAVVINVDSSPLVSRARRRIRDWLASRACARRSAPRNVLVCHLLERLALDARIHLVHSFHAASFW